MLGNDSIKNATSVLDYIFRELAVSYLGRNDLAHVPPASDEDLGSGVEAGKRREEVGQVVSHFASRGYTRGHFKLGVVHGNAAPKMALDEEHEHDHAHELAHEDEAEVAFSLDEDADASFEAQMREIRGEVIGAAGSVGTANPVGAAVATLERRLSEKDKAKEVHLQRSAEAKMKGYEGDACGSCGNFTLVRNGTCMKCNTCGSTSGCS